MPENYPPKRRRKRRKRKNTALPVLCVVLFLTLLVTLSLCIRLLMEADAPAEPQKIAAVQEQEEEKPSFWSRLFGSGKQEEPEPTQPELILSTASIASTGDILMHLPVIDSALRSGGSYDFNPIFRYMQPYTAAADFAAANLETTLCGTGSGYKYSGYPAFNCPDEIVDALSGAGFDMLLTANNHCYDTSETGFLRTVRTVRSKGLEALGTRAEPSEPTYLVQDINGIRVGMVCYTYEGPPEEPKPGVIYMNRNALSDQCAGLINSFLPTNLTPFYAEVRSCIESMKRDGAEATIIYIHWGVEYQTIPNGEQQIIAQQLCDLGFDVIVGGHPHVIQPMELLTSRQDPEHKTVCLYSTGNAVSNQRIAEMDLKTGHTEDGILLNVTFSRYADGAVYLDDVNVIPCWVDLRVGETTEYDILPLDGSCREDWKNLFDLTEDGLTNAGKSYDRTWAIVGSGLQQVQDYLSAQRQQRETAYLSGPETADAAA